VEEARAPAGEALGIGGCGPRRCGDVGQRRQGRWWERFYILSKPFSLRCSVIFYFH
jgi:hypothetical protein